MKNKTTKEEKIEKQFRCSDCKKEFNLKDRAAFSHSFGQLCSKCWSILRKIREANKRKQEEYFNSQFENKIRKIVNKVIDEREKYGKTKKNKE